MKWAMKIWLTTGNSIHIYLKATRDKTYFQCSWKTMYKTYFQVRIRSSNNAILYQTSIQICQIQTQYGNRLKWRFTILWQIEKNIFSFFLVIFFFSEIADDICRYMKVSLGRNFFRPVFCYTYSDR